MLSLRRKSRILLADLALIAMVVFGVALLVAQRNPGGPLAVLAMLPVAFYLTGLYERKPGGYTGRPVLQVLVACVAVGMTVATMDHLVASLVVSRRFLVGALGLTGLLLIPWRILIHRMEKRGGGTRVPVVIVSGGATDVRLLELLRGHDDFELKGVVDSRLNSASGERMISRLFGGNGGGHGGWHDEDFGSNGGETNGGSRRRRSPAALYGAPTVVVSDARWLLSSDLATLVQLRRRGIQVREMPDFWEEAAGRLPVFGLSDEWVAVHSGIQRDEDSVRARIKRMMDIVGALFLLLLLAVPTAMAAAAIRLHDRGAVLFRQRRMGKDGRAFAVLKLRTMRENAEADGPAWTEQKDARITPVGRWIRKSRLDEVPQLWNVLRGEMSLVGPRPEAESLSRLYTEQIPRYELRHMVKPGITGWAQVSLGNTCSVEEAATKLEYDLYYIRRMSPVLDVRILMKTVYVMLFGRGR